MGTLTTFFVFGLGMCIWRGTQLVSAGKRLMPEIEAAAQGGDLSTPGDQ